MSHYFKLVALSNKDWLFQEFLNGKVHFGWSWPGSNLRVIKDIPWEQRTEDQKITWRYTRFLIERIHPGDRVILQFERPMRKFLIAEVVNPGYDFNFPELDDFNHFIHCKPLTNNFISINAPFIPESLKHDLTKRGHYYEIYPESSIKKLDEIIENNLWQRKDAYGKRTMEDELDDTYSAVITHIIKEISEKWPSTAFESFCTQLCEEIDYIEVKETADRHMGWDTLIRIMNPVIGTILLDNVPVQCKNHIGKVTSQRPIDDLVRCIKNSGRDIAYLFILGNLAESFNLSLDHAKEKLQNELGKQITFEVVDQETIAALYLKYLHREEREKTK